ncbi:MAG: RnfABCDGE type electron transport complex subunit G [Candidatus Cloacimonetes bacterium]|nr:RnfABCDGE type electron transport complex subunit G [Candidatus Cloacimonadota bacterium]
MKYYIRLGFVLLVIAVISSGILAYVNSITKPIIDENKRREKEEARKEVLPQATSFDSLTFLNGETAYIALDRDKIVGYTFVASLYGYSSEVKTMVGLDTLFHITRIKIIEQQETPGLGANCSKSEFQEQFSGKDKTEMQVDKDGGSIASITGATITTRTIASSIRSGMEIMEKKIAETDLQTGEENER